MKLPSGITTEQLREHVERQIANGTAESGVLVRPVDLLALLVAMDLRERLDPDVQRCALSAQATAELGLLSDSDNRLAQSLEQAAERVLKHEPGPDLSKAPS